MRQQGAAALPTSAGAGAGRQVQVRLHLVQPAAGPRKRKLLLGAAQPPVRGRCLLRAGRHRGHAAVCHQVASQPGALHRGLKLRGGECLFRCFGNEKKEG